MYIGVRRGGVFSSKSNSRKSVKLQRAISPLIEVMEQRMMLSASAPLTGTVIGTPGSYNNSGNTIAKVFDGNVNNYFDGPTANGDYAGLDLGTAKVITQISYAPRPGYGSRMVGGIFQGSDSADFSGALTTLYTVTASPASGSLTTVNVSSAVPFRYVRYLSPASSYGDIGEVKFIGFAPAQGATLGSDGTLAVYGSNNADTISLTVDPDNKSVSTTVDGTTKTFTFSTVKRVVIGALGGDDTVTCTNNGDGTQTVVPVSLLGGDGVDRITADNPLDPVFVDGGAGDDTLLVDGVGNGPGVDVATLHGGDGDDRISGLEDSGVYFVAYGDEGNDILGVPEGSGGTLYGGAGNDTLASVDPANTVVISGGDGTDTYQPDRFYGAAILQLDGKPDSSTGSGVGSLQLDTDIENITVDGNSMPSDGEASTLTINGNSAANAINVINAYQNSATINGGNGNDTINVYGEVQDEAGPVTINCGSGNNTVTVRASESTLNGGSGNDTLTSDSGNVVINGGGGNNDLAAGGPSLNDATINGGTGNDTITTVEGDFLNITGGSGSNVISVSGGQGAEPDDVDPYSVTITGGSGGDTITGSAYYATLNGGSGNDSINFDGQDGLDVEAGNGTNEIIAASPHLLVNGGSGSDTIHDATLSVFDSAGNPTATLNGGAGNDTIYGDYPEGDTGYPDTIDGGPGNDTAYIDPAYDTVTNVENVHDYFTAPPTPAPLTGTVIGTAGSYKNSGNTIAKVFDGNVNNYFDGPTANGDYAGLDLGSAKVITQISYAPRPGYGSRMVGGIFQGSSTPDFSQDVTTLFTVTSTPASNAFTRVAVSSPIAFRYVRYLAPNGSNGDVGEVQFTGYTPTTGATVVGNTLAVYGTSGDDSISVTFDDTDTNMFVVNTNGMQQSFSSDYISSLLVETFDGNNSVHINGNYESDYSVGAPLTTETIIGGNGNDLLYSTIQTGYGSEELPITGYIFGGEGNDHIDFEGADSLVAVDGNGNDTFYTQAIQDNLTFNITAGNGNDGIDVGSVGGSSSQYGTVNFGTGNDSFFNSDFDDHTTVNVDGKSLGLSWTTSEIVGRVLNASTGAGVSGVQVYLDNNGNGKFDSGDTAATTDSNGVYAFTGLTPDPDAGQATAYSVRLTLPAGKAFASSSATSYAPQLYAGDGESGDDFVLASAAATGGSVGGKITTSNNAGVAGATVYLDTNNNSVLDSGELSTKTLADGSFSFTGVAAGDYIVRQVIPAGQKQTSPASNYGIHITVANGSTLTGENFTDASTGTASIAGTVFNDANNNQKKDTGEAGLKSFTMYLDLNNSGSFVAGDPTATTDANGNYTFASLAAGTYIVRVETPSGYSQTTPTQNYGQHETVTAGQKVTGAVFGERKIA